ncbi:hypothetical protein [Urechidicola croceus]|uniref:Uncharacterized protein n=1 Tax=Urechidicola croceus TaxID=1850246 RepID=A0A1D8P4C8_9FLAO|nr:hypothetical protein [Urechidicola croceus]AOW19440.1 hypothetical protein LPB138_01505 [Urechidicola croceus]
MKQKLLLIIFGLILQSVFCQKIKYNDRFIEVIIISTTTTNVINQNKTDVFTDNYFIDYDDKKKEYKVFYTKKLVQFINKKMSKPQYMNTGYWNTAINNDKIEKLVNAFTSADSTFVFKKNYNKLIIEKIHNKSVKHILKSEKLYKNFSKNHSKENQEIFFNTITNNSLKTYVSERFNPNDEIINFPKSFTVTFVGKMRKTEKNKELFAKIDANLLHEKIISFTGNTANSTLHPWSISKCNENQYISLGIIKDSKKLDESSKNILLSGKNCNYNPRMNFEINFALENILPNNFWNKAYTTTDGIIKDYVLWKYNNFNNEFK